MTRYLLTKAEQKELRAACNYMGLSFHAQAARPAIARQLIRRYQAVLLSTDTAAEAIGRLADRNIPA